MSDFVLGNDGDQSLVAVINALKRLEALSELIDYRSPDDRLRLINYIFKVRKQYQDAETVITGKAVQSVQLKTMTVELKRSIEAKQVRRWIEKLRFSIESYLRQEKNDTKKQLKFVRQQYPLIDVALKVVNGDAYFLGVPHDKK